MKLFKQIFYAFFPLCMLLTGLLALFSSGSKSLWFDEAYSVYLTRMNIPEMFHIGWNFDGNAWFYYLLLHFWIFLGTTETIVRGFSALFAVLTIPAVYLLVNKLFDGKIAKLTVLLLSINTFFIAYSQEARGYTLLLFLLTFSIYFFSETIKNSNKLSPIGYIVFTALAFYTHLFSVLIFISEGLFLLLFDTKKIFTKKYIVSNLIIVLLVLPLFISPAFHAGQLNATESLNLKDVGGIFLAFTGGLPSQFILYYFVLFAGLIHFLKNKRFIKDFFWEYKLICTCFVFPMLFLFLVSLFKPIFYVRYLLISLIPFTILFSISLSEIREENKKIFNAILTTILILAFLSLAVFYMGDKNLFGFWSISKPVEDWRGAINAILAESEQGDVIIVYAYFARRPVEYYLDKNKDSAGFGNLTLLELSSGPYFPGGGTFVPDPNIDLLKQLPAQYKRVWLILSHHRSKPLNRERQANIVQSYLSKNYTLTVQKTFYEDVNIYLYQKSGN